MNPSMARFILAGLLVTTSFTTSGCAFLQQLMPMLGGLIGKESGNSSLGSAAGQAASSAVKSRSDQPKGEGDVKPAAASSEKPAEGAGPDPEPQTPAAEQPAAEPAATEVERTKIDPVDN